MVEPSYHNPPASMDIGEEEITRLKNKFRDAQNNPPSISEVFFGDAPRKRHELAKMKVVIWGFNGTLAIILSFVAFLIWNFTNG